MGSNNGYSWYCDTKKLDECSNILEPLVDRLTNIGDSVSESKSRFGGDLSTLKGREEILSSFEDILFSLFNVKKGYTNIIELIDTILEMNKNYTVGKNSNVFKVSSRGSAFTVLLGTEEYKRIKEKFGYDIGIKSKKSKESVFDSIGQTMSNSVGAIVVSKGAISSVSSIVSSKSNGKEETSTSMSSTHTSSVKSQIQQKKQNVEDSAKLKEKKKSTNKSKFNSIGKVTGATTTIVGTTVSPSLDKVVSSKPPIHSNSFNIKDFLDRLHITITNKPTTNKPTTGNTNSVQKPDSSSPNVPVNPSTPSVPNEFPEDLVDTPIQGGEVVDSNVSSSINSSASSSTSSIKTTGTTNGTYQNYKVAGSTVGSISNEQVSVDTSNSPDLVQKEEGKLPDYNTGKDLFDIEDIDDDLLSSEVEEVGKASKGLGPVIPIVGGVLGATALGIGAKVYKDNKSNNELDLDEDRLTNENKFWTDEEAEVIHSEKEVYEEEKQAVIDTKYRAIHNDIEESDTWSMDEEVDVNSTIDLLESN